MVKLVLTGALLMVILAIAAEATVYKTTITVEEVENPTEQGKSCSEQIQRQRMENCMVYLRSQRSPMESLRMVVNPRREEGEEHLEACCDQLRMMDEMCRCDAISRMVRQQKEEMGKQTEGMQRMMQKARELPGMCNMQPTQCQIRMKSSWF